MYRDFFSALVFCCQLGVIGSATPSELGVREASEIIRALYTDLEKTSNKKLIIVSSWIAEGVALVAYSEARVCAVWRRGLYSFGGGIIVANISTSSFFELV